MSGCFFFETRCSALNSASGCPKALGNKASAT